MFSHGDNFHQVWSWYDYLLPSYSILADDTLRDLVTLTSDLLISISGHTWLVTWSTHPPSLKILWLSYMSCDLPEDTTDNAFAATAHAPYHMTYALRRANFSHIFEIHSMTPICVFTIQLFMRLRWRLRAVYMRKLSPVEIWPQNSRFGERGVLMLNFGFVTYKRHILAHNCICAGVLTLGDLKNPLPKK